MRHDNALRRKTGKNERSLRCSETRQQAQTASVQRDERPDAQGKPIPCRP